MSIGRDRGAGDRRRRKEGSHKRRDVQKNMWRTRPQEFQKMPKAMEELAIEELSTITEEEKIESRITRLIGDHPTDEKVYLAYKLSSKAKNAYAVKFIYDKFSRVSDSKNYELIDAIILDDEVMLNKLIEDGNGVDTVISVKGFERTLLQHCVYEDAIKCAEVLVRLGADPVLRKNEDVCGALALACLKGHFNIAELIVLRNNYTVTKKSVLFHVFDELIFSPRFDTREYKAIAFLIENGAQLITRDLVSILENILRFVKKDKASGPSLLLMLNSTNCDVFNELQHSAMNKAFKKFRRLEEDLFDTNKCHLLNVLQVFNSKLPTTRERLVYITELGLHELLPTILASQSVSSTNVNFAFGKLLRMLGPKCSSETERQNLLKSGEIFLESGLIDFSYRSPEDIYSGFSLLVRGLLMNNDDNGLFEEMLKRMPKEVLNGPIHGKNMMNNYFYQKISRGHYSINTHIASKFKLLVDYGFDFNAMPDPHNGDLPVHYAAAMSHGETLLMLLDDDHLLRPNSNGFTPLHYALESERMEISCYLIKRLPQLRTMKDKKGRTPEDLVSYYFKEKMERKLLSKVLFETDASDITSEPDKLSSSDIFSNKTSSPENKEEPQGHSSSELSTTTGSDDSFYDNSSTSNNVSDEEGGAITSFDMTIEEYAAHCENVKKNAQITSSSGSIIVPASSTKNERDDIYYEADILQHTTYYIPNPNDENEKKISLEEPKEESKWESREETKEGLKEDSKRSQHLPWSPMRFLEESTSPKESKGESKWESREETKEGLKEESKRSQHLLRSQKRSQPLPWSPMRFLEESTSPLESNEESASPLESKEESTSPLESKEESTSPLESKEGSTSPLQSKEESTSPLESKEESTFPLESKEESKVELKKESKTGDLSKIAELTRTNQLLTFGTSAFKALVTYAADPECRRIHPLEFSLTVVEGLNTEDIFITVNNFRKMFPSIDLDETCGDTLSKAIGIKNRKLFEILVKPFISKVLLNIHKNNVNVVTDYLKKKYDNNEPVPQYAWDNILFLKSKGLDTTKFPDTCGDLPIHYVATYGNIEVVKQYSKEEILLGNNLSKMTGLHYAMQLGHYDFAEWIMKTYPQSSRQLTSDGQTALDILKSMSTDEDLEERFRALTVEVVHEHDPEAKPKIGILNTSLDNRIDWKRDIKNICQEVDLQGEKIKEMEEKVHLLRRLAKSLTILQTPLEDVD